MPLDQATSRVTHLNERRLEPISNAMFVRQMDEMRRAERRNRMAHACGPLSQSEIAQLIQRAADVRTRYMSAALDAGRDRGAPNPEAFRQLETLRHWSEELERGLDILRAGVERGEITVEGVDAATY